jgi:SAM-dependent methyltransferase
MIEQVVFPRGIEELIIKLQDALVPETPTTKFFDWQSLHLGSFYTGLLTIREQLGEGRFKFLDVGSGIGSKLFIADSLGFEPYGIEHNPDYIAVSVDLFPEYVIFEYDALDFTHYEQFDVIYSYRLARNNELQQQINAHIIKHMHDDAIFFATDSVESINKMMASDDRLLSLEMQ